MSTFTMIVIEGILMILGGVSLMVTPLTTFVSAGYFIIVLFFVWGIFGVIQGFSEKRYNKEFFFSILSLILGIVGLVVPGAVAMQNSVLLYLAAGWFIVHGVLTIADAIVSRRKDDGVGGLILGVILGVIELAMGIYSIANPALMAVSLGLFIGAYFIESGMNTIVTGMLTSKGGNSKTVLFTVIGILMMIGGFSVLMTPLQTALSAGYCLIILFFIHGVIGVVRGLIGKSYGKGFFFSILSLILGIIGFAVPGMAELNNAILLYMAGAWLILHAVLAVVNAVQSRKEIGTGMMVIGIILGVLELALAIYTIANPVLLAATVGLLAGLYFIESGLNMIFIGSAYAKAVAFARRAV